MSDIVAELDAEFALIEELPYRVTLHVLAKRARDEIVALRERNPLLAPGVKVAMIAVADGARAEALDEAAMRCDRLASDHAISVSNDSFGHGCAAAAAAIRALKDKR